MRRAVAVLEAERARIGEELKRADAAIGDLHRHKRAVALRLEIVEIGQAIAALKALLAAFWPREEVEWALEALAEGATRADIADESDRSVSDVRAAFPIRKTLHAQARQSEVLAYGLTKTAAARVLGVSRRTVQRRARKMQEGLDA